MNKKPATQTIHWKNLVDAIYKEECILVLGPNICTFEQDNKAVVLNQLLAEHLSEKLLEITPKAQLLDHSNLAYVAQQLEEALLTLRESNHQIGRARTMLREIIQKFYQDFRHTQFPVFKELAKLPFRFIVNTCPDHFLHKAFQANRKFEAQTEFYHYGNPKHNNDIDEKEVTRPDIDAPMVYNLFGSVGVADSLVITETNQLEFLDTILQQEKTAGIPNSIAMEFVSSQKKNFEKTYIFLGFDFNQWHLRLIVYLINRYEKQKEAYALQNPKSISDLTTYFYDKNYKVEFVDSSPSQFAKKLWEEIQNHNKDAAATSQVSPKLKAFLMYAHDDQDCKDALDQHLTALKRNQIIETWDEKKIQPGSNIEQAIEEKIQEADIILLLVTAQFIHSDKIYEQQLQKALLRHEKEETTIIPIVMKSCLWQSTLIGQLTAMMLPWKNSTPLMEQADHAAGLTATVQRLEKWCDAIYQTKMDKNN